MPDDVLHFWFDELAPADWWSGDPGLDARIRDRFADLHAAAALGELDAWRDAPRGRLAEVLVLDQFSRHLHRGTARAFACDAMALALAQEAVRQGADRPLAPRERGFLYMPYMHSESRRVHRTAETLFSQPGLEHHLRSELAHRAVIDRFGRYPSRNAALGRASTDEEIAFLAGPAAW